ncbi:MAG TPA: response regulator transcription factor [Solirubrobacterales bacterium]|nr:response regulator transcription factor [Solirubrobacterales bacterium]
MLVDDHEALRDGLEDLLERRGIKTIGTAATAADAVELLREVQPDVAVIGIRLPDGSGLQLTRHLCADHPDLAILIYTGVEDVATLAEALESGARGFALKTGSVAELVQGLRLVARGERYVDPRIRALLDAEADGTPLLLTKREREIFDLLAQGMTGEKIAARLSLSPDTVRTHVRNGMEKLHMHTRTGAVVKALKTHEIEG